MRGVWIVVAVSACGSPHPGTGPIDAPPAPPVDSALPAPDAGPDPANALFDPLVLHRIEVELPPASVDAINAEARPPGICQRHTRSYYRGDVTIDGTRFEGVGVRARGNGTAEELSGKPSLRVHLSWDDPDVAGCPADRRYLGKKKLNLINMRQDPAFVRIPLAGELAAAVGVPHARAGYARLIINGEDTGVVALGESIDRQFLDDHFADNDGMMFESGCYCELSAGSLPPVDDDEGPTCFEREFSVGPCDTPMPGDDPTDWTLLREFIAFVDGLPPGDLYPAISTRFDFDRFLSLWAMMMILGSGDGYFFNQNSYRIYHDPSTDQFTMVDHGSADGIFRTLSDGCNGAAELVRGTPVNVFEVYSRLPTACLAEADCEAAYAARLWQVLHTFEAFGLEARATALHDFILPEAATDPRYFYNGCGVNYTWPQIEAHWTDYVLPWIRERFGEVRGQLLAAGFPEPI